MALPCAHCVLVTTTGYEARPLQLEWMRMREFDAGRFSFFDVSDSLALCVESRDPFRFECCDTDRSPRHAAYCKISSTSLLLLDVFTCCVHCSHVLPYWHTFHLMFAAADKFFRNLVDCKHFKLALQTIIF